MIKQGLKNIIINNSLCTKLGYKVLKSNFQNSIITYHGVSDKVCPFNSRHITTKNFEKQLRFFKSFCNIITLEEFVNEKFHPTKINIALTFDDGYQNNYLNVLPLLEQFKTPATFFITGINSIKQDYLWADYIEILQKHHRDDFTINEFDFTFKLNTFYDKNTNKSIHEIIKFISPEFEFKQQIYNTTPQKIKDKIFKTPHTFWKVMSDIEIAKASQSSLISIQSHGLLHNNLGSIQLENAKKEILSSKKYLENLTQKQVIYIGYPDGSYSKETINYCIDIGFKHQFATDYYLNIDDFNNNQIHARKGVFDIGTFKNQLYNSLKLSNPSPNRNKKILHIIPCLAGGGAEILVGQIALEQINQGYDVHILLLEKEHFTYQNYPFKKELENATKIHKIECASNFSIFHNGIKINTNEINKLIIDIKPSVIHSHLYKSEIIAHNKIFKNINYISHLHDNMPQFDNNKYKLYYNNNLKSKFISVVEKNWILKQYLKCNNRFISISKDTTNYFQDKLPKSLQKNIYELNNAINLDNFCRKKRENLPTKLVFVNVGNLVEKKGHNLLIEIFNILDKEYNMDFQLNILGFGPLLEILNNKIKELNLTEKIFLRGNVKNVNEYMEKAHIYIHTASYEPFGMVFLEAMASGLPIISSNGKGNKELVISDYNGYLIDSRYPVDYVNKIIELLGNIEKYSNFSKNSLNYVKKYDIKEYVKKLSDIYFMS